MARKNIEINQASGKRIKELLKENKITQIDFADTIHCTSEHLSAIINGRRRLTEECPVQGNDKRKPALG